MEDLKELLQTYKDTEMYKPSTRGFLSGSYFNSVLANYDGLIKEHITLRICKSMLLKNDTGVWESTTKVEVEQKSVVTEPATDYPSIMHVIIEAKEILATGQEIKYLRHANLIIIDSNEKAIYRFDPYLNHGYHDYINYHLAKYFQPFLPNYSFSEIKVHPQKDTESKIGMCVAYVIKAAVQYVVGEKISFKEADNEADMNQFAGAIEKLYPTPKVEDVEGRGGGGGGGGRGFGGGGGYRGGGGYGYRGGYGYGGYGGFGAGLLAGGLLGAGLSYPYYSYPYYYYPPYGGYVYV